MYWLLEVEPFPLVIARLSILSVSTKMASEKSSLKSRLDRRLLSEGISGSKIAGAKDGGAPSKIYVMSELLCQEQDV